MSWIIALPIGILIGILFSSAYPEMASGINETVAPSLHTAGETVANKMKEVMLSMLTN